MTTYYFESKSIGQEDGHTFYWSQPPELIGPLMHTLGPIIAVHDDKGADYSGDEFWDMAGILERWEVAS